MKNQVLTQVQRLRAIAALLVVTFHTIGIADKYGHDPALLRFAQPWGSTGVDLFFVISGFIMVHIQQQRMSTPWKFFAERLLRIAPLYWFFSAALISLMALAPAVFNSTDLDLPWVLSSFAFMAQAMTGKSPLLYDGWTLEYEMFFYLVFSVALNIRRLELSVCATSIGMVVFYMSTGHMIVIEFVFGMMLGLIKRHQATPPVSTTMALAAGLVGLYFAGTLSLQSDETRAWAVGIPAAFIVYAGIYMPQWPADFLTRLGDASYSIYLAQVFSISAWYKLANKLDAPQWNLVLALGCVSATAFIGLMAHEWIEKNLARQLRPLKRWLDTSRPPRQASCQTS